MTIQARDLKARDHIDGVGIVRNAWVTHDIRQPSGYKVTVELRTPTYAPVDWRRFDADAELAIDRPEVKRRTQAQIDVDREAIIRHVRDLGLGGWIRPTADMRPGDIDALVKLGRLRREVRREWDQQGGYAQRAGLFGGAGVVQRHRAYIALPEKEEK